MKTVTAIAVVALSGMFTTSTVRPATAAHRQVFDLQVLHDDSTVVDVGKSGRSVGDQYIYANVLGRRGLPVGVDGSSCTITALDRDKVTTNCLLSVELSNGQLTAQALWTTGQPTLSMAITGGTGAFRNATGTLTCKDILKPTETYHIDITKQ